MAEKLNVNPIGGNILIKPVKEESKTASGLIIQTSKEERSQKGEVIALGTGQRDENGKELAWNVKVGDIVLYKKYSPEEIELEGETYLIMKESDILAVIK